MLHCCACTRTPTHSHTHAWPPTHTASPARSYPRRVRMHCLSPMSRPRQPTPCTPRPSPEPLRPGGRAGGRRKSGEILIRFWPICSWEPPPLSVVPTARSLPTAGVLSFDYMAAPARRATERAPVQQIALFEKVRNKFASLTTPLPEVRLLDAHRSAPCSCARFDRVHVHVS